MFYKWIIFQYVLFLQTAIILTNTKSRNIWPSTKFSIFCVELSWSEDQNYWVYIFLHFLIADMLMYLCDSFCTKDMFNLGYNYFYSSHKHALSLCSCQCWLYFIRFFLIHISKENALLWLWNYPSAKVWLVCENFFFPPRLLCLALDTVASGRVLVDVISQVFANKFSRREKVILREMLLLGTKHFIKANIWVEGWMPICFYFCRPLDSCYTHEGNIWPRYTHEQISNPISLLTENKRHN